MAKHADGADCCGRFRAAALVTTLTDRELLARFTTGAPERRLCRSGRPSHGDGAGRVPAGRLPNVQDAEDACQATFLVLANRARDGRWQESVANWLYTTARRVAFRANRTAARRVRREARATSAATTSLLDQITGREAFAVLDEELDKLPARFREPLVLCYLEGLTRDEAAARLGVPAPTLKSRLDSGRKKLGDALTKRGVALGAGLLAVAVTSSAGASPPNLVASILTAASGRVSPAVGELAKGVAVNGVLTRIKLAAVAAIGLAVMGFGLAAVPPAESSAPETITRVAVSADPKADPPKVSKEEKGPGAKERTIAGRVLDAKGEPVVAELFVVQSEGKLTKLGKTKADGTFRVTVSVSGYGGWLCATAPGHGTEFLGTQDTIPSELTLRLPKDRPIRGQIVDQEGKPLPGARGDDERPDVSRQRFAGAAHEALDGFWCRGRCSAGRRPRDVWFRSDKPGPRESESPISVTTDRDGKFEITGVGADQLIGLTIRGSGLATTEARVMNRTGFDPKPYLEAATQATPSAPFRGQPERPPVRLEPAHRRRARKDHPRDGDGPRYRETAGRCGHRGQHQRAKAVWCGRGSDHR